MEALIYARFSKIEQAAGASAKRQIEMAHAMCEAHGWVTAPDRTHVEEGKSAFSGANRAKGSWMHEFERECVIGLHRGRVLVLEAVDRVSRQGYSETLNFLNALISQGVTVATTSNQRIYPAYKPVEMMEVIEVILHSELAAKESQQKSRRVRDAFSKKRAAAAKGEVTVISSRTPSWIKVVDGKFVVDEERANIVREIYQMAAQGHGTMLIAKILNDRNVRPWLEHSNGWHEAYIYRLLKVRSVLGEYVTKKYDDRILDYYPAIIDADLYDRVALARQRRATKTAGRQTAKITNLLSGIVRCHECGNAMTVKLCRTAGRNVTRNRDGKYSKTSTNVTATYLYCYTRKRNVRNDAGELVCTNGKQVRLDKIEPTILDEVLSLALDGDRFAQMEASDARVALAEVERQITFKKEQAQKLGENLKNQISDTLMSILIATEGEIKTLEADRIKLLDSAAAERGAQANPAMLARIREVRSKLDSTDQIERLEARSMVADALRNVITDIYCDNQANTMVIVAHGLAAFRMDRNGRVDWRHDASGDAGVVEAMTTHAYEANAPTVVRVIQRAKAIRAERK